MRVQSLSFWLASSTLMRMLAASNCLESKYLLTDCEGRIVVLNWKADPLKGVLLDLVSYQYPPSVLH